MTQRTDKWDAGLSAIRAWYFDEIRSLAVEALREFPVKREDDGSDDENEEARNEWADETVDGHEFVIYTAKAQGVLLASDSSDAYEDDFGAEQIGQDIQEDGGMPWSKMAYSAMRQDLAEQIESEIRYPTPAT